MSRDRGRRPGSMAGRGIGHVGLKVSSVERSRKFYREIFGLTPSRRQRGISYLPSGGDLIVLYEEGFGSPDLHFGFRVDSPSDVDEWRDWFKSKHLEIEEHPKRAGHRSVKVRDPDGHAVEVFYEK